VLATGVASGVPGLGELTEVAEVRLELSEVRGAVLPHAQERLGGVPLPAIVEVHRRGPDDQRTGCGEMALRDLQRDETAVAPAADHRPVEVQRGDERGDVIGHRLVSERTGGVRRAAVPTAVEREDAMIA
jgi:hypothetical protein